MIICRLVMSRKQDQDSSHQPKETLQASKAEPKPRSDSSPEEHP